MELRLFVSSPSDCAAERDLVIRVAEKLAATEIARSTGLTLKVVRWEDLPPGETTNHNYQARIDEQLRKVGLDRAHIYVGFMRDRIGTPTHGCASGTVYEFETALASRRRTGLPAEVFFYFLREEAEATAAVSAFSGELRDRGVLYSVAAKEGEFELRLTQHLSNVMLGWWQWRNRVRRGLRSARVPSLVMIGVAIAAYLVTDVGLGSSIQRALNESRREEALRLWSDRHAYFPITTTWLKARMPEALRSTATERLLESLLALGGDPFSWEASELQGFEIAPLREHLQRNVPRGDAAPTRYLAYTALTRDWDSAEQAATGELSGDDPVGLVIARAFARHGPTERVARWLKRTAKPEIATPITANLLDIIARREDAALTATLLDLLAAGRFGQDAQSMDLPLKCGAPACRDTANALLTKWAVEGAPPSEQLLATALEFAELDKITISRTDLADALVRFARAPQFSTVTRPILQALATLNTERARAIIRELFSQHLSDKISFGWAEKSGLIDAAAALGAPDDRSVLRLAQLGAKQALDVARPGESPSDGMTQARYVAYLAARPPRSMAPHLPYLRSLIDRRLESRLSIWESDFDQALASLLPELGDADLLALFEYTGSIVVDDFGGKLSERRVYLLQQLHDQQRDMSSGLATAVIRMIPVLPDRVEVFRAALARHGGSMARDYFRRRLAEGDTEVLEFVASNGDEDTMRSAIPNPKSAQPEALKKFLDALSNMQDEARRRVFADVCLAWAPDKPRSLWADATALKYEDDGMIDAAVAMLRSAADVNSATRAIRYLQAVRPSLIWKTLSEPAVRDAVVRILTAVEPFDFVMFTQELPPAPADLDVTGWMRAAASIRKITALEQHQIDLPSAMPDRLMRVGEDTWIGNPLLRALATGKAPDAAKTLLDAAERSGPVQRLGKLSQEQANFDAYLIWLAAARPAEPDSRDVAVLFEGLRGGSPVYLRARAGLALARLPPQR